MHLSNIPFVIYIILSISYYVVSRTPLKLHMSIPKEGFISTQSSFQRCSTCKWFINRTGGLCGFYKTRYDLLCGSVTIHEYAEHCRKNENLCGPDGYMYEQITTADIVVFPDLQGTSKGNE